MASQLTFYSVGVAAENKSLSSRYLAITPTEITPALDGEINFNPTEKTFTGQDAKGDPYELKMTEDLTLSAEWLPLGSNRVTPPDIRRGEPIAIYRLADSDQFYWRCLGLRDDLRRLETVIYAFNANPDEGTSKLDFENCYLLEISTHQKLVTFTTSTANGEPFRYTFQFNTAEGQVVLTDDVGNYVELDSAITRIRSQNADNTWCELNKRDLNANAPDNIYMEAGKQFQVKVGASVYTMTPGGTTLRTPDYEATQS